VRPSSARPGEPASLNRGHPVMARSRNAHPRWRLARQQVSRRAHLAWRDQVAPYGLAVAGLALLAVGGFAVFGRWGWFVAAAAVLLLEYRIHETPSTGPSSSGGPGLGLWQVALGGALTVAGGLVLVLSRALIPG